MRAGVTLFNGARRAFSATCFDWPVLTVGLQAPITKLNDQSMLKRVNLFHERVEKAVNWVKGVEKWEAVRLLKQSQLGGRQKLFNTLADDDQARKAFIAYRWQVALTSHLLISALPIGSTSRGIELGASLLAARLVNNLGPDYLAAIRTALEKEFPDLNMGTRSYLLAGFTQPGQERPISTTLIQDLSEKDNPFGVNAQYVVFARGGAELAEVQETYNCAGFEGVTFLNELEEDEVCEFLRRKIETERARLIAEPIFPVVVPVHSC